MIKKIFFSLFKCWSEEMDKEISVASSVVAG